ncbi:A24 family peptidase [Candidatus Pacearchaeota archaeon]|nr:A24 family peptidase [Candidatus Pacearchaeota archaeon]
MQEYYFLFGLAFVWIAWATVQDLRTREVSNWLNFSLVAFALAYRAFYSVFTNDFSFFMWGIIGFGAFFCLAYAFYYAKAFAGGDAKLLMGLGAVLPFGSSIELSFIALAFIFLLFFLGALYSLLYSIFIVNRNYKIFKKEFESQFKKYAFLFVFSVIASSLVKIFSHSTELFVSSLFLFFLFPLLYFYLKSLEVCMIKKIPAKNLTEGDWLHSDIRVGGKVIKKSVHGLIWKDIKLLRKFRKPALVREGIPFVPAFLFAFVIMVFFWATSRLDFQWMLSFLS